MSLVSLLLPISSKLSLSKKISILLILPLVIQILIFLSLCSLLEKTQHLAELEAQESELVEAFDQLLMERADAWGSVLSRALFSDSFVVTDSETYKERIQATFAGIRNSTSIDSDTLMLIDAIERSASDEYKILKNFEDLDKDPQATVADKLKLLRPALKMLGQRTNAIKRQIFTQIQKNVGTRSSQRAARDRMKIELTASILIDIFAACAIGFFFISNLNKRLDNLTKNAKFVSTGESLPYQISGHDELSALDAVLHNAHRDLQEAKQYRQSLNSMIAHDLRSPLMTVQLVIESIFKSKAVQESEDLSRKIESLNLSISRVFSLVEDLLTIEKLEAGKLELDIKEIDIKALVSEALLNIEEMAQSKALVLINETDSYPLIADRNRIMQVLLNYLTNAIKFAPNQSEIRVTSARLKNLVTISVQDEGPGISRDEQFLLFEKFYRTSTGKKTGGFGIGLAICKLIITQHGGELGVTSRPGKGATFWFSLPIDDDF